jgi:isocitrate dehydrogenase
MFARGAGKAMPKIYYTYTDEAPALATHMLAPVVFARFLKPAGIALEMSDISVASRVLAQFGLDKDNLAHLGEVAQSPDGYIIKLPNVSASTPQLQAAIKELQSQGFKIPDYPLEPKTPEEKEIAAKYAKALGSSVNPVLREGNSDRHAAPSVKAYAQKFPKKLEAWPEKSKTHVAHMSRGDFYESERSYIVPKATSVRIEHTPAGASSATVLKKGLKLVAEEVIDASFLSVSELRAFFETEFQDAKAKGVLTSLHLKATMMKISDPIMFGHAVSVFYRNAFEKYGETLAKIGANPNFGLGSVLDKVKSSLPEAQAKEILAEFERAYTLRSNVAMVDSARGITNFHVPSDVIIDASMPPMIRDGGKMWNKDNKLEEVKCIVPDRCYATQYQAIIQNCLDNGAFNAATMGQVSNIGLMAKKAEEYGSHDKTFELPSAGTVRVVDENSGEVIFEHKVGKGDIWRMCQTKDVAIKDWVELAYRRALEWNTPAIFWLDSNRAHDVNIIKKVLQYTPAAAAEECRKKGIDITIMSPQSAARVSCDRARKNLDTISVTGNVMRDYNTDMFPILTLGTSSRTLSIVPFLNGGGMYETGAGGSAPKHVQQFVKENHLRWDSLGEYQAVAACLLDMGKKYQNPLAVEFGESLDAAIAEILNNNRVPGQKVKQLDNRGCHFYLALYWAKVAAKKRPEEFGKLAEVLEKEQEAILKELIDIQGDKVDLGGYYRPDKKKADAAMNPSARLNEIFQKY